MPPSGYNPAGQSRKENPMTSFDVGDVVYCPDCGLEMKVTKACKCEKECVIKCCDTPLKVRKPGEPAEEAGGSCCCG